MKKNGLSKKDKRSLLKWMLIDFLGYLQYKLENDLFTLDEMIAIRTFFYDKLDIMGTSEDFARYYGKPAVNVRVVINRKLLAKPVRKVLYPFKEFSKVVPDTWKTDCNTQNAENQPQ